MAIISSPAVPAAEPMQALPARSGQIPEDLSELDDRELLALAGSLPGASGRRAAARDLLVSRHRGLVLSRWQVHVDRSLQELVLQVREATGRLAQQLGRTPADAELAGHLGVREADIRDVRRAEVVLQPRSLDEPAGCQASAADLADSLGGEDPRLEHMLGMRTVTTHWGELPAREQKVLILRFYGGMTQTQIGQQLGLSQMQVSRLLARWATSARASPACPNAQLTARRPHSPRRRRNSLASAGHPRPVHASARTRRTCAGHGSGFGSGALSARITGSRAGELSRDLCRLVSFAGSDLMGGSDNALRA